MTRNRVLREITARAARRHLPVLTGLVAVACLAICGAAAEAGMISWSAATWDHSSYGGSAGVTGWDALNQGVSGGVTSIDGVDVTVAVQSFGTAQAYHSFFNQPPAGDYLSVSGFNGRPSSTPPALAVGMQKDYSSDPSNLQNFGVLSIDFSVPVALSSFTLGDIDIGGGWQDLVSVSAQSGGALVPVAYSVTPGDYVVVDGSLLVGKKASSNTTANAEADVAFDAPVDRIEVTYFNGNAAGAQHGIYILDDAIAFSAVAPPPAEVPEPHSIALWSLMGVVGMALYRRRRS